MTSAGLDLTLSGVLQEAITAASPANCAHIRNPYNFRLALSWNLTAKLSHTGTGAVGLPAAFHGAAIRQRGGTCKAGTPGHNLTDRRHTRGVSL